MQSAVSEDDVRQKGGVGVSRRMTTGGGVIWYMYPPPPRGYLRGANALRDDRSRVEDECRLATKGSQYCTVVGKICHVAG